MLKYSLHFAIFNFSEKLQNIFEIRLKIYIWSDSTKITLGKIKYFNVYMTVKSAQSLGCKTPQMAYGNPNGKAFKIRVILIYT